MKRYTTQPENFELAASKSKLVSVTLAESQVLDLAIRVEGSGPRVLVIGGTHGDEFEGQIAAVELARALPDLALRGTMIVMPFHNTSASRAGTRETPSDRRDLNRAYGRGNEEGPTARIAHFVTERLLPEVDLVIDLHSGGRESSFVLSSNLQSAPNSPEYKEMRPMLMAFDAPYAITFDEVGLDAMPHIGTLEGLARAQGKRALSSELGGTGGVTTASLAVARNGLVNVLNHAGSVKSAMARPWHESQSVELSLTRAEEYLTTPIAGWFVPRVSLGEAVLVGDPIGEVVPDVDPFGQTVVVTARTEGVVAALWHPVRCKMDDVVACIAARMPKTSAG